MLKDCSKCEITKPITEFYKHCKSPDGIRTYCKVCSKEYNTKNRNWIYLKEKEYWAARPEQLKRKNKIHQYKRRQNLGYRLATNLRCRISKLFRLKKVGSHIRDLGCSIPELKQHLESKFQSGMSWDNYGKWHIDHIKPVCSFNLDNREQLLIAVNYTNLQPLWAIDNLKKAGKF